jgi:hypothetical protein
LVTQPSALVINTSLGVNSVPELVALLKREPEIQFRLDRQRFAVAPRHGSDRARSGRRCAIPIPARHGR